MRSPLYTKVHNHAGFIILVLSGTLVWLIWNESFTLSRLVQGLVLSWLAFSLTNRFLLQQPYQDLYRIKPLMLLRYLLVLMVAIFRSGVHAIHITLTRRIDVGVADLPSRLENPFQIALVATAITLTPGTVTVDSRPGSFKVIWIECGSSNPEKAADMVKGEFERIFLPEQTRVGTES